MTSTLSIFHFPFNAMASANELQIFAVDQASAKALADDLITEVQRIESKFSRYQPESIISKINSQAGSDAEISVDQETAVLLDYAGAAYQQSSGLFDITCGVLRRAWDFRQQKLPTQSQLQELLPLIGWNKVLWRDHKITLPIAGMQIDFGGIGKEYAVDRVAGLAMQRGAVGLVNLGGDVRAFGQRADGMAWKIGITHPRETGGVISVVPLKSGSVATSGDYERFIEVEGKRYSHILNPKTGWSASGLQTVSVMAESCLIAGSVSTTAMLKGSQGGIKYLKEIGLPAVIVDAEGKVITI